MAMLLRISTLAILSCSSVVAVGHEPCVSTANGQLSAGCHAEQTSELEALLQTNKLKVQQVNKHEVTDSTATTTAWEDIGEPLFGGDSKTDPEVLSVYQSEASDTKHLGEGFEMLTSYEPEHFAALQTASLLQQMNVKLSEDGSLASVGFVSKGQAYEYNMVAVSCYTESANISIWTGTGYDYMHPGQTRTFRSREEGRYASARIHEDGSVSGLFEQDGRVIDVRPLHADDTDDPAFALLAEHTEAGQAHIFSVAPPLDLARNPFELTQHKEGAGVTTTPYLPTDEEEEKFMATPCPGCEPKSSKSFGASNEWGGVKWYPGCYSGDSSMHTLEVGFAIPPNVFSGGSQNKWPTVEKAKVRWEEILAKASWIYEKQMNVMLKLGNVKTAQSGGPAWAMTGCGGEVRTMLNNMKKSSGGGELNPQQASWHGFVNCGQNHGVMGVAYVGTLCEMSQGYNTGANKWQAPTSWFVYAHELGHNFAGKHSFEEGQGKTGGVMDYGDGKLNGHYQFNTKYRKNEICKHLQKTTSCDKFKQGAAPAPPPPPPPGGKPPSGGGGRYEKGPANTNKCPGESTPITDVTTCSQAAKSLGLTWREEETVSDYPKGCYFYNKEDAYKGVYYNKHGSGAATDAGEPICKSKACEVGPPGAAGPPGPKGPSGPRGPPGPPA